MDKNIIGFGIAGNFANHLEQAGESADFVEVEAKEGAPKGIFPTYVPNHDTFLGTYPFSSSKVTYVEGKNTQMEPEVALYCDVIYDGETIKSLTPTHFGAYNDCSMRVEGAKKISHKKNWGKNSKAITENMLAIDKFSKGGVMDNYSLTSFIKRDGKLIQYGENSELLGYSYFYETLNEWIVDKLNTQQDVGPLEDLKALIKSSSYPKKLVISIGATRYTDFGEHNYLDRDDELYVVVYNHKKYSHDDIIKMIEDDRFDDNMMSVLKHRVV